MERDFLSIERKHQERWLKEKVFEVKESSSKKKFYVLEMFPYPSGSGLHMGHAWNYTIGDIFARFKIMQGFNVLHPMGYDALGLPAENAAIKDGIHPEKYTQEAINNFIRQQKLLGLSYDWSRLIDTSQPEYYKWDQWIFLKMFERGLAYRKKASVNWCPGCQTVLANEQVKMGRCERCGTEVEMRFLEQWFLRITDYAKELLDCLDDLDWPERTKAMQRNWIGKSVGVEIDFEVNGEKFPIFTTRPDTIFGVTFMVISAQHPDLMKFVTDKQKPEVEKFLKKIKSVSKKSIKELEFLEKEGVFTGSYAKNPLTGELVPIYAGNFVVADYGSGMVMAVPAHDQRDFEFAKKYGIKIKQVIEGPLTEKRAFTGKGKLVNSGKFSGLDSEIAKEKIKEYLIKKGLGRIKVQFKLKDWLISRQRYWGTPIPIVYCDKCGIVPVPEDELPVVLPKNVVFGKGNPLESAESWINTKCPKCGGNARRETDTMDTFVNSSWYFLRYCDPKNDKEIFDKKKVSYWCPIDVYIGGAEHACMHLIYFRFYTKFLADLGLINFREPAKKLFHQGMLHAEDGQKMSKSRGVVVLPEDVSKKYGIDTARFFLCSLASPDKDIRWSEKGINGSLRFIKKVFDYFSKVKIGKSSSILEARLNQAIDRITSYFENFQYRKASIEIKELFEFMEREKEVSKETLERFLKLLTPICPHICEELWERLGNKGFISLEKWPKADLSKIKMKREVIADAQKLVARLKKDISNLKRLLGKENAKVYVYALPDEAEIYSSIEGITVFAVNNKNKYDPEGKSKKVKPGRPAIYIE